MKRTSLKSTKTLETKGKGGGEINLLSEKQDKQTKAHGHKGWARQMVYMAFSPPRQETVSLPISQKLC